MQGETSCPEVLAGFPLQPPSRTPRMFDLVAIGDEATFGYDCINAGDNCAMFVCGRANLLFIPSLSAAI